MANARADNSTADNGNDGFFHFLDALLCFKAPPEDFDDVNYGRAADCTSTTTTSEDQAGVVLLDSGTGESKVIFAHENRNGQVVIEEVVVLQSLKDVQKNPQCDSILQEYVDAIQHALDDKKASVAVAGLTAWFRALPNEEKNFYREFFEQRLPNVKVLELEGAQEAMFEAAAVNYAAGKSGLGKPSLQIAAGGGSVNLVYEDAPYNIETGFRLGQTKLLANGLSAVEECERMATQHINSFLSEAPIFQSPKEGSIIAISACYYAAKGTGIAKEEAISSEEVVRVFTERKDALIETIKFKDGKIEDKKVAQELSNMILQTQVFKRLTAPGSKVFFRRDWILSGEKFRTTWTAGYYISKYSSFEKKT